MQTTNPTIFNSNSQFSYFGDKGIVFVHNWRAAGTSLHSLFKANFKDHYLKIGDSFDSFGKSSFDPDLATRSATLRFLRMQRKPSTIVAGHVFVGLDAFLHGRWDYWMNVREPLERVRSGLLRFHSRPPSSGRRNSFDLIQSTSSIDSIDDVRMLLDGPLRRECNGISRRLAAITLAPDISISDSSSLERCGFLDYEYDDEKLFMAARKQLKRINVLFLADQLMASIVCLERLYKLPPVLNPFVALRHNSAKVAGYNQRHIDCLDSSIDILKASQRVDSALWPVIIGRFQKQLQMLGASKHDIAVRELIHSQALFDPSWFCSGLSDKSLLERMAKSIVLRSRVKPRLASKLIDTLCSWPVLAESARSDLSELVARYVSTV